MFSTKVPSQDVKVKLTWARTKKWKLFDKSQFYDSETTILGDRLYFANLHCIVRYLDLNSLRSTELDTPGSVTRYYGGKLVPVADQKRLLLIGGIGHKEEVEVRSFHADTEKTNTVGRMPQVFGHTAEYSPARNAVVIFGGIQEPQKCGVNPENAWELEGIFHSKKYTSHANNKTRLVTLRDGSVEISELEPMGSPPSIRYNHLFKVVKS